MLDLNTAIDPDTLETQKNKKFVEKSVTNVTSVTGAGFSVTEPSPNRHFSPSKRHKNVTDNKNEPDIQRDLLIEETITKQGIRRKLAVDSKAAIILSELLLGRLAYNAQAQTWHEFTGTHWAALRIPQAADKMILDLLYAGCGDLGFRTAYKNGIKSILTESGLLALPNVKNNKIPFKNGLLDPVTRELAPIHWRTSPTWCLPYDYEMHADCPTIKAWLNQAVEGDTETVQFLRAWMAAVLHGRNDLQKFLHLKGSGGTGKGVFTRLLSALVGEENTVSTSLEQLEKNRFETANLYGKRLLVIPDSDKYGGSINTLKSLTGQDFIRIERKHQQQMGSFIFGGLVVMASNESLQTTDHTSGLDRRRITAIFDRRATSNEKAEWESKGNERGVLHVELPGLVNWLLVLSQEDISRIIRNPPDRIIQADKEAMADSNPVANWLIESCEYDPEAWCRIGHKEEIRDNGFETSYKNSDSWLYANFLQWCLRVGKNQLALNRFKDLLVQSSATLGHDVYKDKNNQGAIFKGLRLKNNSGENRESLY